MEFQFRREIPVELIADPSNQLISEVLRLKTSPGLKDPIIAYLKDGTLPNDRVEAQKLQHLAIRYTLLGNVLYKRSYSNIHSDPYLRCLGQEARKVMQEIHDGDCRNHSEGRSLTHKVINQGYYWLKMFNDTKDYMKKCSQCQRFTSASNRPSTDLHTLCSPWPFMR